MPIQKNWDIWKLQVASLFHQLANAPAPKYTEVRIRSRQEGARRETPWLPLGDVSYRRPDNLLEIAIEDRTRLVFHPKDFCAGDGEEAVLGIDVERTDGTEEVVELR